jgi:hypothetical protein
MKASTQAKEQASKQQHNSHRRTPNAGAVQFKTDGVADETVHRHNATLLPVGLAPPPSMVPTGYSLFRVTPKLLAGINAAETTVVSLRGVIAVSWLRTADDVWVNVTLPVGADTPVTVPLPSGCVAPKATVRESTITDASSSSSNSAGKWGLVWSKGVYIAGVPGVANAHAASPAAVAGGGVGSSTGVVVICGSGVYAFAASCTQ